MPVVLNLKVKTNGMCERIKSIAHDQQGCTEQLEMSIPNRAINKLCAQCKFIFYLIYHRSNSLFNYCMRAFKTETSAMTNSKKLLPHFVLI